jgi:hypothetical protein
MDLRSALKGAGVFVALGAALAVLSRFQPEATEYDAPWTEDWAKNRYGPCPHPGCGRRVDDMWPHHSLNALQTPCGHLVEKIPEHERVDAVRQLRLYRHRR